MFRFTSIKDYHAALNAEHTTCVQAVKYYLDQITANENLNAYLEIFSEEALSLAAHLDAQRNQGKTLGKLHGVVIGIKDVLSYREFAKDSGPELDLLVDIAEKQEGCNITREELKIIIKKLLDVDMSLHKTEKSKIALNIYEYK